MCVRSNRSRIPMLHRAIGDGVPAFLVVLSLSLAASSRAAETVPLDEYALEAWDECRDRLGQVIELEAEKPKLPRRAWVRRDWADVDEDIDSLLDRVLNALELSEMTDCRRRYTALDEKIGAAEARLAECREARVFAPVDSGMNPFAKTRQGYDRKIEEFTQDIAQYRRDKAELVAALRKAYGQIGIELSSEQVSFYLSSVSGKDIVGLSAVFHNVGQLNAKLEELVAQSPGNTETAKRYYGIHVVLIRTLIRAHETIIRDIEEHYVPKISELRRLNEATARETDQLMEQATDDQRTTLLASRNTQEETAKALNVYGEHLEDVKARLGKSLEALNGRYQVAKNAYDTIRVAASLVSEMQACIRDLTTVSKMHLPDLLPLDSEALQKRFGEITTLLLQ